MTRIKAEENTTTKTKRCNMCKHTEPWHDIGCPQAMHLNCFNCQAVLPRHYPWCAKGQRDAFYCWQVPREEQRNLEIYYNEYMKTRRAQQITGEKE